MGGILSGQIGGGTSASQTDVTASDQAVVQTGKASQYTSPGSILLGTGGTYLEPNSVALAKNAKLNTGTTYSFTKGYTGDVTITPSGDTQAIAELSGKFADVVSQLSQANANTVATLQSNSPTSTLAQAAGQDTTSTSADSGAAAGVDWKKWGLVIAALVALAFFLRRR